MIYLSLLLALICLVTFGFTVADIGFKAAPCLVFGLYWVVVFIMKLTGVA